jgi:glutathione peroxidase-family protein
MEMNGLHTHPIFKFLKRNTPELYDESLANGRPLKEDFCKFLISPEG